MAHKTRGTKTNYPSDVSDEEWAFCAPYLTLMKEDAPQRDYSLRAMFNAVRYMVRAGCPWRMIPNDLPPWSSVQQQAQRWIKAGCFEAMAHDLRKVLRLLAQRQEEPSAVIVDGRCLRSTPERGSRAGYDGHKRKKGSKVHAAVDTPANEQERTQIAALLRQVQAATGEKVEVAFVFSRLYRSTTGRGSGQTGHSLGGGKTRGRQKGIYPLATTLGRRTILCLGRPIPPLG